MAKESTYELVFKILPAAEWHAAQAVGTFAGSAVDLADGFIHFSTARQMAETAAKHFAGQTDLMVLAVDPQRLESPLTWEPSRGGDLFPHLYGPLPVAAVTRADPLPLGEDGTHVFPTDLLPDGEG